MEILIYNALQELFSGRVFPDVAPEGTTRPYATYQAIGGSAINFTEGSVPGLRNARVQVNVWADTRMDSSILGNAAENILRGVAGLQTTVLDAATSIYEPDTGLYGQMQDFGFWY